MPNISLESTNFPNRFIRHQNFLGELTEIQSDLDKQDASFSIQDGIKFGELTRITSLNFPVHVLRHQDFRIKLVVFNPPLGPFSPENEQVSQDSLFTVVNGLANPSDLSLVSFRSLNFPDRFIRHRDFHLFVEPVDNDLGRSDATFRLVAPFFVPPPIILH